jgi:hypothetical protein
MEVTIMAEMMSGDYDAVDIAAELKLSKTSGKESKNKHKLEARRKIDDLLEQKRLRRLLDLDDEEELSLEY